MEIETIFAAEDDPIDQRSLLRTFKKMGESDSLTIFEDGLPLLERLSKGEHPDCILLDMGLPTVTGQAVLDYLQAEGLQRIPVFVMTTSNIHQGILEKDGVKPSGFLRKPLVFNQLIQLMEAEQLSNA